MPAAQAVGENEVAWAGAQARRPGVDVIGVELARKPRPPVAHGRSSIRTPGAEEESECTGGLETERFIQSACGLIVLTGKENQLLEAVVRPALLHELRHGRARETFSPVGRPRIDAADLPY